MTAETNRAAIYTRVSTTEQAQEGISLDVQKERCLTTAQVAGYNNTEIIEDAGYSAKDLNRPGLQKLLSSLADYDAIYCFKVDRLARNLRDLLEIAHTAQKHNCALVSITESFDTGTPAGKMMLHMLGSFAQFEREMIAERVTEAMRQAAKKAKVQQKPPLGYRIEDGKFIIDQDEATLVKLIYKTYLEVNGVRETTRKINLMGLRTKRGYPFHYRTVAYILKNSTYTGLLSWGLNKRKNTEPIVTDGPKSIISKEMYRRVQERRAFNRGSPGRVPLRYPFSGLINCYECKSPMTGRPRYTRKGRISSRIMVCSNYQKDGGCYFNFIDLDELTMAVAKDMRDILKGRDDVFVIEKNNGLAEEKELLERNLASLKGKFDRQMMAFEEGAITTEQLKEARVRLEEQECDMNRQLAEVNQTLNGRPKETRVRELRTKIKERLESADPARLAEIIHNISYSKRKRRLIITYRI